LARAHGLHAAAEYSVRSGFLVFGGAFTSRDPQKMCLFKDDPLHLDVSTDSDLDLPEDLGIFISVIMTVIIDVFIFVPLFIMEMVLILGASASTVDSDGQVLIIGGWHNEEEVPTRKIFEYNPKEPSWAKTSHLDSPVCF
jgi:hypothetical protein